VKTECGRILRHHKLEHARFGLYRTGAGSVKILEVPAGSVPVQVLNRNADPVPVTAPGKPQPRGMMRC